MLGRLVTFEYEGCGREALVINYDSNTGDLYGLITEDMGLTRAFYYQGKINQCYNVIPKQRYSLLEKLLEGMEWKKYYRHFKGSKISYLNIF